MAISSLVVETAPDSTQRIADELAGIEGVEVQGTDPATGKIVVVLEADSIGASHDIASSFAAIEGVFNVNLVYVNVEDELDHGASNQIAGEHYEHLGERDQAEG